VGSVSDSPVDLAARRTGLEELWDRLAQAADGTPKTERDLALADAIARYGVREEDLRDVLTGVEMDLTSTRIETYDQLRTYCYHVASAVGLATLPILTGGVSPTETLREAAVDLGLGMQYVNILRDVDEDLALGRIYLPSEELAAHGVDEVQLRARTMSAGLRAVLATHGDRAGAHLSSGRRLLAHLPRRSRACPWVLSEIYGRILARIVEAGYCVFGQRASLPAIEKLWLLLSSAWRRV
jgi:phytoene synthase